MYNHAHYKLALKLKEIWVKMWYNIQVKLWISTT